MERALLIIGNIHRDPSSGALLQKLIRMTSSSYDRVIVISGDNPGNGPNVIAHGVVPARGTSMPCRALRFVAVQAGVVAITSKENRRYLIDDCIIIPPLLAVVFQLRLLGVRTWLYRGGEVRVDGGGLLGRLASIFLRHLPLVFVDRVVVESHCSVAFQGYERYEAKIEVIPQYVPDAFTCQRPLSMRNNIICTIGSLTEGKGILELIRAAAAVRSCLEPEGWVIRIIGDGPIRERAERLVAELGLDNLVELHHSVPHDEVPRILNDCQLLILPSYAEGVPNIMLEAMACETPVLVTPVGGVPDLIEEGITGLLIGDLAPTPLGNRLLEAIHHPSREAMAARAAEIIEYKYREKMAISRWDHALSSPRTVRSKTRRDLYGPSED